jgi:hypothetical protein
VQELAIRDLKEGAGLNHCPPGCTRPTLPGWCSTLAHNLLRWTALLGALADGPIVAKTLPMTPDANHATGGTILAAANELAVLLNLFN